MVFKKCRDRIQMIARLHQRLYSSDDYSKVTFGDHLRDIADMLVRSQTSGECDITLQFQADPMEVNIDTAIALGLIADEVILNSLKHAFKGRRAGTLCVELRERILGELVVSDDGIGLPDEFDPKSSSSLGLELVLGLTRQINGKTIIENRPSGGSSVTILFPLNKSKNETTPSVHQPENTTS